MTTTLTGAAAGAVADRRGATTTGKTGAPAPTTTTTKTGAAAGAVAEDALRRRRRDVPNLGWYVAQVQVAFSTCRAHQETIINEYLCVLGIVWQALDEIFYVEEEQTTFRTVSCAMGQIIVLFNMEKQYPSETITWLQRYYHMCTKT
jgi:hypothetical protein